MSSSTWYDIHTKTLSIPTGQRNPIRKPIWTEQSPPFPYSALWKTLSWYWIKESSQNVNEQTPAPLERITSIDILTFVYTNYIHVLVNWDVCLAAKKRWRGRGGFSLEWQETSFPQWHDRLGIELKVKSKWCEKKCLLHMLFVCWFVCLNYLTNEWINDAGLGVEINIITSIFLTLILKQTRKILHIYLFIYLFTYLNK